MMTENSLSENQEKDQAAELAPIGQPTSEKPASDDAAQIAESSGSEKDAGQEPNREDAADTELAEILVDTAEEASETRAASDTETDQAETSQNAEEMPNDLGETLLETSEEGAAVSESESGMDAESEEASQRPAEKSSSSSENKEDHPTDQQAQEVTAKKDNASEDQHEFDHTSLSDILNEMETLVNKDDAATHFRRFAQLKEAANQKIQNETDVLKADFVKEGNPEELFTSQHPSQSRFSALLNIYREKTEAHQREYEAQQAKNLEQRQNIIEKLKNLYTNTEAGTNLFKAIREIKEEWKTAGQVAKSEFKLLNNNYFHHLNQFYQMLDLNKEYMEQEFAHNLEKRQHIISRARELETEPSVQKALNELQYLHKLWKEEAEPVAEEFREKTWDEFKEISNRIHDRKAELSEQIAREQSENLTRKNAIIAELQQLVEKAANSNHSYWQNAIKKVDELRAEFLGIGNVPRKVSSQNWNEFKQHLRNFNTSKNSFYKNLKNSQQSNLDAKLQLIQTAKDNMTSEDWETAVPLFKKLQEEWKQIGHVPRSMTNKIWDDFREACNVFFKNYREKNNTADDNWRENYKNKRQLLEELKQITDEEGSVDKIEAIKTKWNSIGKVPREKLSINSEFNKALREKLKLNKITEYDLKDEGLSENQLTDKARKIKNQIADLEAEVVKMENNLGFFSNPSRENPLLAETYRKIDDKKTQIESMKQSLHTIVSGEN